MLSDEPRRRQPLYMDYGPDWPPPPPRPSAPVVAARRRRGRALLVQCASVVLAYALVAAAGCVVLRHEPAHRYYSPADPPVATTVKPAPCTLTRPCERRAPIR